MPPRLTSRSNSAFSRRKCFVFLAGVLALGAGLAFAQQTCTGISRKPNDVVVYIVGAVKHPCMYVVEKRETITITKALALTGGISETAKATDAKVIHRHEDGSIIAEVPVDLREVLRDGAQDVELGANDILFIPDSRPPRPPQPRLPPGDLIPYNHQLSRGALCPLVVSS